MIVKRLRRPERRRQVPLQFSWLDHRLVRERRLLSCAPHACRRLAVSLFLEWRQHQRRPGHVNAGHFQALLSKEHKTSALRLVLATPPSLKNLS